MNPRNAGLFLLFVLLTLPFAVALNGFVVSVLWAWFIAPLFGLGPLTIPQAIGLTMFVSYLTYRETKSDSENSNNLSEAIVKYFGHTVGKALIVLGFAWVVAMFI